jgi:hypothetical protein
MAVTARTAARITPDDLAALPCPYTDPCGAALWRKRVSYVQDYLWIDGDHLTAAEAAKRVGVTERVIVRYRAWLRDLEITP